MSPETSTGVTGESVARVPLELNDTNKECDYVQVAPNFTRPGDLSHEHHSAQERVVAVGLR